LAGDGPDRAARVALVFHRDKSGGDYRITLPKFRDGQGFPGRAHFRGAFDFATYEGNYPLQIP